MENKKQELAIPYEIKDEWVPDIVKRLGGETYSWFTDETVLTMPTVPPKIEEHARRMLKHAHDAEESGSREADYSLVNLEEYFQSLRTLTGKLDDALHGEASKGPYSELLTDLRGALDESTEYVWRNLMLTNYILAVSSIVMELARVDREVRAS